MIHLPRGRPPAGVSSECRSCGAVVSGEQMACLSCGSMVERRRVPWRTPAAGVVALMLFGATGISFAMSEVSTGDELKVRKIFSAAPAPPPATPAPAPGAPTSPPAGDNSGNSSAGSDQPPKLPSSPSTPPVGAPIPTTTSAGSSSFQAGGTAGSPGGSNSGSSAGDSDGGSDSGSDGGSDGGNNSGGSDDEPGASPATKNCEGPTRGGTAPGWPAQTTAYTVVLRQTADHAKAMAMYDRARAAGAENGGVLCADDYPLSFNPSHKWVTFAGQCKTREAAERERGRLEEKNLSGKVVLVDGGGEAPADASGSTSC